MKLLNNQLTESSQHQLFNKSSRKFQLRLKRLFKLPTNKLKFVKFQQSNKRLSLLKNSKNILMLSTMLKLKSKLLIDMNQLQFQSKPLLKRLLRFLKFLRRLLKELSSCLKLSRFLNTSMKSMKMMVWELLWLEISKSQNLDIDNFMEMPRNN